MVKVIIPGKPWADPLEKGPVWRRVAVHLLKDLAAQPRASMQMLVLSILVVTFFYLGLPYVFYDGTFYRQGNRDVFVSCDYFGYASFTKDGPDCPWVTWRKP